MSIPKPKPGTSVRKQAVPPPLPDGEPKKKSERYWYSQIGVDEEVYKGLTSIKFAQATKMGVSKLSWNQFFHVWLRDQGKAV